MTIWQHHSAYSEAKHQAKKNIHTLCDPCLWVPVTTAWCVLRLWMEERPPIRRVAANKLNKQSRTADKG